MTERSLNDIFADMEQSMPRSDAELRSEFEHMDNGDLIGVWLRSSALARSTRQQQLAFVEIGRRGLSG